MLRSVMSRPLGWPLFISDDERHRGLAFLTLMGSVRLTIRLRCCSLCSMATKTQVVLVDDLTGDPADTTVKFALDKTEYEIDLSNENAA
jgi:Lsr2